MNGRLGGTQSGSSVALKLGESATCTITNDDKAAHLTLVKTVINNSGGTAVTTDFILSAAGPTPISGAGGADSDVMPGSYNLSETNLAGYTAGAWSCLGGAFTAPDKIALVLGQAAICTITNTDQKATPTRSTVQGWVLHDRIYLKGIRTGAAPEGTMSFRLYSDSECKSLVAEETGLAITVDPSGNGTAVTAKGVLVTAPGTYYWIAEYTGDQRNEPFITTCGDESTTIAAKDAANK